MSILESKQVKGRRLELVQEVVLCDIVIAMGFVARKVNTAFEFLKRHKTHEDWSDTRTWKSPRKDQVDHILLAYTIQALGISARRDLKLDQLLSEFRDNSATPRRQLAGDIVQADFYLYVSDEYGREGLFEYILGEDLSLFKRWRNQEGKASYQWARRQLGFSD